MAGMIKFEGAQQLSNKLKEKIREAKFRDVLVGYSANYALHVHENLEMKHPNGGQAKFLEQPARENVDNYLKAFVDSFKTNPDVSQCLLVTGLVLQRDSQELVPVKTGNLKASGFTTFEDEYFPPTPSAPTQKVTSALNAKKPKHK